jgi:hypothetical protein
MECANILRVFQSIGKENENMPTKRKLHVYKEGESVNTVELAKHLRSESFDNNEWGWKFFGSLRSSRSLSSRKRACQLYHEWFGALTGQEDELKLNFVRIDQLGEVAGNCRFYILIGGCGIGIASRQRAMLRWTEIDGGKAFLYPYRAGVFCRYVLDHVRSDSDVEISMNIAGCPWTL